MLFFTKTADEYDTQILHDPTFSNIPSKDGYLRVSGLLTCGWQYFSGGNSIPDVRIPSHRDVVETFPAISNTAITAKNGTLFMKLDVSVNKDGKTAYIYYETGINTRKYKLKGIKHKRNKNVKHINTSPYAQPE